MPTHADRSLAPMAQTVRRYGWEPARAVGRADAVRQVVDELRAIFHSACRVDRRRKHPATCHRLLSLAGHELN